MCQYELGPFHRVVGWVNLSVVAFCYLGWYRHERQQGAPGPDRPYWQRLRTAGLREKVRGQVQRADLAEVLRLPGTAAGPERLRALLDRISDDPAATAA
jgi:hypothetical protein